MNIKKDIYDFAGRKAIRLFKKQINRKRPGSKFKMQTSGTLRQSLKVKNDADDLEITSIFYGDWLNKGQEFSTVFNFTGRGNGKQSPNPYISGLVKWLGAKKGLQGKAALKAAFAIARSKINKGEKTPKNLGWVDEIKKDVDQEVSKVIGSRTKMVASKEIHKILNRTIKT